MAGVSLDLERNNFNFYVDINTDGQLLAEFMERGIPGYHDGTESSSRAGLFQTPIDDDRFCSHNHGLGSPTFCCVRKPSNSSDGQSEDFTKVYNDWQEHIDSLNASDEEDLGPSQVDGDVAPTNQAAHVSTSQCDSQSVAQQNYLNTSENVGVFDVKPKIHAPADFLNTTPVKNEIEASIKSATAFNNNKVSGVKRKLLADDDNCLSTNNVNLEKINQAKSDKKVDLPPGTIILAMLDESGSLVPVPHITPASISAPEIVQPIQVPSVLAVDNVVEPTPISLDVSEQMVEIPVTLESNDMSQITSCFLNSDGDSDIIITADALKQFPELFLNSSSVENPSEKGINVVGIEELSEKNKEAEIDVETIIDKAPVLEACDLNTLLVQFEASEAVNKKSSLIVENTPVKLLPATKVECTPSNRKTPATPKIKMSKNSPFRLSPTHQNIKDSLPKEIIEKIKASTKRKSTQILNELPNRKRGKGFTKYNNDSLRSAWNLSSLSRDPKSQVGDKQTTNEKILDERIPPPFDHDYCISPDKKESSKEENKAKFFSKLPDYCVNTVGRKESKVVTNSSEEGRKDSGVESGNASDSSIDPIEEAQKLKQINLSENHELSNDIILDTKPDKTVYNKLPAYMTDIGNSKPKEIATTEVETLPDADNASLEVKKKKKLNLEEYRMRAYSANNSRCSSPSFNDSQQITQISIASVVNESTIDNAQLLDQTCKDSKTIKKSIAKEQSANKSSSKEEVEEGELIGESEYEATPEKKIIEAVVSAASSTDEKLAATHNKITNKEVSEINSSNKTPEKCVSKSLSRSNSSLTTSGCSSLSSPGVKKSSKSRRRWSSSSRSRSPCSNRSRRRRHSSKDRRYHGSRRSSRGRRRRWTRSRSRSSSTSSCSTCSSVSRSRSRSRHYRRSRDRSSRRYYKRHDRSRTRSPHYHHRSPSPRNHRRSRSPPYNSRQHLQNNPRSRPASRSVSQSALNIIVPNDDSTHRAKQVEERRVVYVGRIDEGVTKSDLRKRFEKYGPITDISVHFRERGDNYGFVTFQYREHAYNAMSKGNEDTTQPKYDLCFGGRRSFCRVQYSDLDAQDDEYAALYGRSNGRYNSVPSGPQDFDALLKAALKKKR